MISVAEILAIHDRVVESTGGRLGLRDEAGLLSAIGRPYQTLEGKDLHPGPIDKAAALLESLCNNHPFVDGNKRTALVAAAYLLHRDGIEVDVPFEEGEALMLEVAKGQTGIASITEHLERWIC